MATPLFTAALSADGKTIKIAPLVDASVSADVNWFGQSIHLVLPDPTVDNDSDGKVWTVTGPAADGSFLATRGA